MKKRIFALTLTAIVLLTACNSEPSAPAVTESEAVTSASEATTSEATTTTKSTTTASVTTTEPQTAVIAETTAQKVPTTLEELDEDELRKASFTVKEGERVVLQDFKISNSDYEVDGNVITLSGKPSSDIEYTYRIPSSILEDGEALSYRVSTGMLASDGDFGDLFDAVGKIEFGVLDTFHTNYSITEDTSRLVSASASVSDRGNCELIYGFTIADTITTKAFVTKSEKEGFGYTIIIDPAYMRGFPVSSSNPDYLRFNINGTEIAADTLQFDAIGGEELYGFNDYSYIYASVTLSDIKCSFSTRNGYANTASVSKIELVTSDTSVAITEPYKLTEDKEPMMSEVYNTFLAGYKDIITDNTVGMELLDLDFDGTPELLISDIVSRTDENGNELDVKDINVDVDIYSISGGKLHYIDTLYHSLANIYSNGNLLGLKTLEDGSKKWFSMSRVDRSDMSEKDAFYLFALEGGKLHFEEKMKYQPSGQRDFDGTIWIDGRDISDEIEFIPMQEDDYDNTLIWGEYNSWGSRRILFADIAADYCKDMNDSSYTLLSEWLVDFINDEYYFIMSTFARYKLSERDFSHNIALLVDDAFLGEYSSIHERYEYYFIGDIAKPIIYLYPEAKTDVTVQIDLGESAEFSCTYPEYGDGWAVTAMPDGTLYDENGDEYYCLYWEAKGSIPLENNGGFCVSGEDTAAFLREKLTYIGLTAREANEFIIYWLPLMQDNAYNVITFHTEDYAASVPMAISPVPGSVIRVFMTFEPSDEFVSLTEQTLPQYQRNGFTVVEWGGGKTE